MRVKTTLIISLLVFAVGFAAAQDVADLNIKNFKPRKVANNGNRLWAPKVVINNDYGLLGFSHFTDNDDGSRSLYSYQIKDNGKPRKAVELFNVTGHIFGVAAVWNGASGVVFFAFREGEPGERAYETIIASIEVDETGEPIGEMNELTRLQAPEYSKVLSPTISAAVGNLELVAAFACGYEQNNPENGFAGIRQCAAVFIRTDHSGRAKGVIEPKINGGDQYRYAQVFTPKFAGNAWLIPMSFTYYDLEYSDYLGHDYAKLRDSALFVYRLKEKKNRAGKKLVMDEKDEYFRLVKNPFRTFWMPDTPGSTQSSGYTLFVEHKLEDDIPYFHRTTIFRTNHHLLYLNAKGKKKDAESISIPSWETSRQYTYQDGDEIRTDNDYITDVYFINGGLYFGQIRCMRTILSSTGAWYSEHQINVWTFNEYGGVDLVARNTGNLGNFYQRYPTSVRHKGKLLMFLHLEMYDSTGYISKLKITSYEP